MRVSLSPVQKVELSKLIKASFAMTEAEEKLIDQCQKLSFETWAGFCDERLVCAWGIVPPTVLSNTVYLWMHTTPAIEDRQFIFVRHSQIVIEKILKDYEMIVGHVKADEKKSRKWLQWLGAEFEPSKLDGMLAFRIKRKWQIH